MKWNKRAKLTATATSALLLTLLLASCTDNNNNQQLPVNNQYQQEQEQQDDTDLETPDNETDSDSDTEQPEATTDSSKEQPAQDSTVYEATGTYVGAIDNNSIEVTIDGEPTVFQLTDKFDYVINDFVERSKVMIKYNKHTTEDGSYIQNILTDISIVK